ncbi:MAG: hypothetical protein Kow00106_16140 [Anaerolineae bacterium]
MTDYYLPEDELPEDISYEDFDDVIYTDDEEFTPIDLDALDDALPAEAGPAAPEVPLSQATSDLLDALDDALPVYRRPLAGPPPRVVPLITPSTEELAEDTERLLDTLDDALPAETGSAAPEVPLSQATSDLLDALDDALPPLRRPTPPQPVAPRATPPVTELTDESERLLDALDDALPAETGPAAPEVPLDQATSDLLDTLDDALPPVGRPRVAPPSHPTGSGAVSAPPQSPAPAVRQPVIVRHPAQLTPAAPPRQVQLPAAPVETHRPVALSYQVLIGLPPELGAQVLELRATGHVEDMPPPGLCLTPRFQTPDLDALDAALERWAQQHLPLSLEISGVQAEVVGAQQYVAAWYVQPQDRLRQVLATLKHALGGLVRPLPGEPTAVRLRITIGDHIAARRYPYVIAQMQRDFEPTFWHAQTLVLASCPAPTEWDIVATYPGAPPRPMP